MAHDDMTGLPEAADHTADALARFVGGVFEGKPKTEAFVSIFAAKIQEVETMLFDLFDKRTLDDAEAAQLDGIGAIVGLERRGGQTDTSYRADLRAWIVYLRSRGTAEEIISVVERFTRSTEVELVEYPPASAIVWFDGEIYNEPRIAKLADGAAGGGVRIDAVKVYADPFRFDGVLDGEGFGTVSDPNVGGHLSTVMQV